MRKKNLFYNTVASLITQIIAIVCSFILPRLFLQYYGSAVNGLVSSITNFLAFISFLDLGVGTVVQSALYKQLSDQDNMRISQIIVTAQKFFERIAFIFLIYVVGLAFIYPYCQLGQFDFLFTFSLIVVISISSFAQYYFGITYHLLLNADQKSYVQLTLQTGTLIINTIVCVILIYGGFSIQIAKLATSLIFLLRPLGLAWYVRRNYELDLKTKIDKDPLPQKWNGLIQHVAAIVLDNTDILVLTMFSTLKNISVYSIYLLVVQGVRKVVVVSTTGVQSFFGNIIATNETEHLYDMFDKFESLMHILNSILFTTTALLIVPFVSVYTKSISDANYNVPEFAIVLVLAQYVYSLRTSYYIIVKAAGHYKETQTSCIVEVILNIMISVLLVIKLGLIGVAIGTLVAMLYRTVYLSWYLSRYIIRRKLKLFFLHSVIDILVFVLSWIFSRSFIYNPDNYTLWIKEAIPVFLLCTLVSIGLNFIAYHKTIIEGVEMLFNRKR